MFAQTDDHLSETILVYFRDVDLDFTVCFIHLLYIFTVKFTIRSMRKWNIEWQCATREYTITRGT